MNPLKPTIKPDHHTIDRAEPQNQFENFIEDTQDKTESKKSENSDNSEQTEKSPESVESVESEESSPKKKTKSGNKKAKLEEKKNPKKK